MVRARFEDKGQQRSWANRKLGHLEAGPIAATSRGRPARPTNYANAPGNSTRSRLATREVYPRDDTESITGDCAIGVRPCFRFSLETSVRVINRRPATTFTHPADGSSVDANSGTRCRHYQTGGPGSPGARPARGNLAGLTGNRPVSATRCRKGRCGRGNPAFL